MKRPKRPHASSRLTWELWLESARKGGVTFQEEELTKMWKDGLTPSEALGLQFLKAREKELRTP